MHIVPLLPSAMASAADGWWTVRQALQKFADNPGLIEEFGRNSYKIFKKKFLWESIADDYENVYKSLI